ncbi:MAG TPA: GAF domain-containing protein [Gammaproteobacteria bacterium]|nr:GAF domain-containing protein [Gammaproteobacteria bacterium]
MHESFAVPEGSKPVVYAALARHAEALVEGEGDKIANAANLAALLYHGLPDVSWCGFYFLRGKQLIVGPFQGKPACVRIALGRGVCGQAATMRRTLVVGDVASFPDHIYCDPDARSEIVLPLVKDDKLLGVLDLDAPILDRFDEQDRRGLEKIATIWAQSFRR